MPTWQPMWYTRPSFLKATAMPFLHRQLSSWRLSEENFLKDVNWLNDLRLTAGYTVLNQDLDISEYFMYKNIFTAGVHGGDGLTPTTASRLPTLSVVATTSWASSSANSM